ncbi:hypothetical protein NL676_017561 [Syzygium grande]|nr:hypothetical protein NL676_017561 [Syzygium grande]
MRAGRPDGQISADSEEQCKQKCLGDCKCQAYSFKEDQRQTRGKHIDVLYLLYFERPQGRYRVTSVNPEARTFTIQVENGSDCTSSGQMEINLQLNQSSPFHVSSGCSGGQNDFNKQETLGKCPVE